MRVCLCLIVRDEAQNIPRLWASVREHVDGWAIVDTGSVDDTIAVVAATMDKPGSLVEREWEDFGTARTQSLELARSLGYWRDTDWLLVLDADETLEGEDGWDWGDVGEDVVAVSLRSRYDGDDVSWTRTHLLRASKPWRYEGVLHEYASCGEDEGTLLLVDEPRVVCHGDGIRTRSAASRAEKYQRDAAVLTAEALRDPGNRRTWFYLGQAHKDGGDLAGGADGVLRRGTASATGPKSTTWPASRRR